MKKFFYGISIVFICVFWAYALAQENIQKISTLTKGKTPMVSWQISVQAKSKATGKAQKYIPWQIIVKFKESKVDLQSQSSTSVLNTFEVNKWLKKKDILQENNIAVFALNTGTNFDATLLQLKSDPNVEYAEPNYIYHILSTTFNDKYTWELRALPQIHRYEAYDMFSGNVNTTGTIVAVLDLWVDYTHIDLFSNMRDWSSCKSETWAALGWCLYGYEFYAWWGWDNDPYPTADATKNHGTHVAGTIAAIANNGKWTIGINPHAKIMALKISEPYISSISLVNGINFARHNWAKVINASLWWTEYSQVLYDAINDFRSSGWIFVVAAGNDHADNEITPMYPCNYTLDNIICVAATSGDDSLATAFSNYGLTSVDVWAPGVNIYSSVTDFTSWQAIYTNTFATSLGDMLSWWTDFSWWISGGMAMGWYSWFTTSYRTGVQDNYIQKTVNLTWYGIYKTTFKTYCDTPEFSTWDFIRISFLSWSEEIILVETDEQNAAYYNSGYILNYTYTGYMSGIAEEFIFDISRFKNSNITLRARRFSDTLADQVDEWWCFLDELRVDWLWVSMVAIMDGTSMATPHVAWLVSLAWSSSPSMEYSRIRDVIINSWDALSSLSWKTVSGKRINARSTLMALLYSWDERNRNYSTIKQSLLTLGIQNNLNTVMSSNVSSFSWLYFAKMSWSDELGRISFATWLDLTDTGTQDFLSGDLPNSLGISQWQIWFTPWTGFTDKNASLQMNLPLSLSWILSTIYTSSFAVREWSGWAVTGNSMITSVRTWACTITCPIYLDVTHFTSFDLRPQLLQVHITSDNTWSNSYARSGNSVTLSFTWSEALTWVSVTINWQASIPSWWGTSWAAVFVVTGGTASTDISFTIDYTDISDNSWTTITTTTDLSSLTVDNVPPTATVSYSTTGLTNQDVIATLTGASESITGTTTHTFTGNDSYTFIFHDSVGNISIVTGTVSWIDKTPITGTIEYSTTGLTNQNVTATMTGFNKTGVTVSGANPYTFTTTGSYIFTYHDAAGNTGSATATVTWIDKTSPTATITYSTTGRTNQNITGTLTWYSETLTWINATGHLFTGNGTFVFSFQDLAGNTGYATGTVTWIDTTAPTITITNVPRQMTWSSTEITWVFTDCQSNISTLYSNWNLIIWNSGWWAICSWRNRSWIFSWLVWGTNSATLTGTDIAGNITTTWFTITRLASISGSVSSSLLSWTSARISFASDIVASGYIVYGISSLTTIQTWTLTWSHIITLNGLTDTTTYIYRAYTMINGITGDLSATWTFTTPKIIAASSISWTVTTSWEVQLWWASSTGITFATTGTLTIIATGNTNNYLQLNVSGLVIQASGGVWNGLLNPPSTLSWSDTGNASFGESWLPLSTEWLTTRTILLTIKAWSDVDSLVASWGYFRLNFVVTWGVSWNTIKLYRSSNGLTRTANTPDATCILNSSLVCSFRTDHLSYFSSIKETISSSWWWGWGWWGTTITPTCTTAQLVCTGGKYSMKTWANCTWGNMGGTCTIATWITINLDTDTASIVGSHFSTELNTAYLYAYSIGITTIPTIQRANMTGALLRKHLAKMISNFAIKELKKTPNTWMICNFTDMNNETTEMMFYSKLACQLGLMGLDNNGTPTKTFSPNGEVTRAQFGTVLSRTLRDNQYNWWEPYYMLHLNALQKSAIMKQINMPRNSELRGYVMLMLMRSVE